MAGELFFVFFSCQLYTRTHAQTRARTDTRAHTRAHTRTRTQVAARCLYTHTHVQHTGREPEMFHKMETCLAEAWGGWGVDFVG